MELKLYLTSFAPGQALKETAAALAKRAGEGAKSYEAGVSLCDEYNLLVRKTRALFKDDPFARTLEEVRPSNDSNVNAGTIAGLAKEMDFALASVAQ